MASHISERSAEEDGGWRDARVKRSGTRSDKDGNIKSVPPR